MRSAAARRAGTGRTGSWNFGQGPCKHRKSGVYSAWRRTGTDDPDHRIHSNYDLLTEDRSQLLTVRNYVTPMLEDPAIVALSPGQYVVKARVQRYGLMEIPVVIESRKLTALFMDDSTVPDVTPNQAERIQLPDGRVIGWASVAK